MWYWTFKQILIGPYLRILNRPEITGTEFIPEKGPAILASNHLAVFDSFYLPLMIKRRLTFPAKNEYFTTPGLKGRFLKWFFTALRQVPLDRTAADAGEAAMKIGRDVLGKGELLGIYPEGTRSPDGRLHRGKTGAARIALALDVPIIPVAMVGTREANPPGTTVLRPAKVRIHIGAPLYPADFAQDDINLAARALTDALMERLAELGGQEYVDRYGADVKAELAAAEAAVESATDPADEQ